MKFGIGLVPLLCKLYGSNWGSTEHENETSENMPEMSGATVSLCLVCVLIVNVEWNLDSQTCPRTFQLHLINLILRYFSHWCNFYKPILLEEQFNFFILFIFWWRHNAGSIQHEDRSWGNRSLARPGSKGTIKRLKTDASKNSLSLNK